MFQNKTQCWLKIKQFVYFVDFNYYEIYEEQLTGASYRKLAFGPIPAKLDTILNQMLEKEQIKRVKTEYHGFLQTRYLPLVKADIKALKGSEMDVIDKVIQF